MGEMRIIKKLRYFEGSWKLTGKVVASSWSSPGRFARTERNTWVEQDWSLVSHWQERQPGGVASGTTTFQYDGKRKRYTFRETDRAGASHQGTGTLSKNTWVWMGATRLANGKTARSRWTVHPISAAAYKFKLQIASQRGAWRTVVDGTAVKSPRS